MVCASYLKIPINVVNFCDFRDFKLICQKKKKSRNIGFHGPIIHQTKLEIKTNILMYYGLIWCNISGFFSTLVVAFLAQKSEQIFQSR